MLNLDKNKKYLLACSFGPDSMALFDMLLKEKYSFEVAHVNYHLREESDFEEKSLREFCDKEKIILHIFQNSKKFNSNVEANCREVRYSFFASLYKEYGFDGLLVAHNEDDLIETYLLQKRRKNLVFHYGLASKNVIKDMVVYRPLLSWTKENLLKYCDKELIPYAIDKTNLQPIYLRNILRLKTVSKMDSDERKSIIMKISNENEKLEKIISKVKQTSNDINDLLNLSGIEFAYYLNIKLQDIKIFKPITYKQSAEIVKILRSSKPNIALNVCGNKATIFKSYDKLFIEKNDVAFETTILSEPCVIDNQFLYADLINEGPKRKIKNEDYPLTIRAYQPGDEYKISNYDVPVRRLFIDWKMPLRLRKRWPLFVNKDNKIVYIPRYREDFNINNSPNFYVKECFTLK